MNPTLWARPGKGGHGQMITGNIITRLNPNNQEFGPQFPKGWQTLCNRVVPCSAPPHTISTISTSAPCSPPLLLRLTCQYHGVVAGGPGTRCSAVCVVWLAHWLRGWLMPCWLDSCKLHVTTPSNMKPTRRGDATLRESGLTLRL